MNRRRTRFVKYIRTTPISETFYRSWTKNASDDVVLCEANVDLPENNERFFDGESYSMINVTAAATIIRKIESTPGKSKIIYFSPRHISIRGDSSDEKLSSGLFWTAADFAAAEDF